MSEPTPRPAVAASPLSVLLFAQALSTDVPAALQAWRQYLDTLKRPYEIFLIQEIRTEVSPNPADEVSNSALPARMLTYERASGFRAALNEAIRTAQYPLIAFCTCDKQYQPGDLAKLFKLIDQVDLVVGYRTGKPIPFWRVLLDTIVGLLSRVVIGVPLGPRECWLGAEGWGRRWVARWIFGVHVTDPECPFRLARREIFGHLPFQSGGPFAQVEMLAKANHLTCFLAEAAVTWTPSTLPSSDAIPFGPDAWLVFREPDFGAFAPPDPPLAA